jgi:signal transduction histidine kinase
MVECLRAFLLTAMICLVFLTSRPAHASSGISEQAYAEDASGQLDFAAAQKLQFIPFSGAFAKGYSNSSFWIRLKIDPRAAKADSSAFGNIIIMRIRPPYLREVEIFDPQNPTDHKRLSGDLYPSSDDEYRSFNLNFVLENGDLPRDIYVRLKTSSSTMSFFEAFHLDELQSVDQAQILLYSAYIFFLLVTFVIAVVVYLAHGELLIAAYALKQFAYILWAIAVFGIYRYYADDNFIPPAVFMCSTVIFVSLASQLFDVTFFRDLGAPKALLGIMVSLMSLPCIGALFLLAGEFRYGMQITMIAVLSFPMLTAIGAFFIRDKNSPSTSISHSLPRSIIIIAYGLIAFFLVISVLPQFGIFSGTSFSLYSNVAHSVASTCILGGVIFYRMVLIRKREETVRLALESTQQQLAQEEIISKERDMLISMLTHELRTPLAAIQMSLALRGLSGDEKDDVNKAFQDINSIISRCLDASRIDAHSIYPEISDVDVSNLVQDLIVSSRYRARFQLELFDEIWVKTDKNLLQVILLNLFENAQKYGHRDSTIRVLLREYNDYPKRIEISVINHSQEGEWPDSDKIFSKFYRGAHAHRLSGSGLGLYIVKALVEKLGGNVFYDRDETDVCFRVVLPC